MINLMQFLPLYFLRNSYHQIGFFWVNYDEFIWLNLLINRFLPLSSLENKYSLLVLIFHLNHYFLSLFHLLANPIWMCFYYFPVLFLTESFKVNLHFFKLSWFHNYLLHYCLKIKSFNSDYYYFQITENQKFLFYFKNLFNLKISFHFSK